MICPEELIYFPYSDEEVNIIIDLVYAEKSQKQGVQSVGRSVPNYVRSHSAFSFSNFYDIVGAACISFAAENFPNVTFNSKEIDDVTDTIAFALPFEFDEIDHYNMQDVAGYVAAAIAHFLEAHAFCGCNRHERSTSAALNTGPDQRALTCALELALAISIGRQSRPLTRQQRSMHLEPYHIQNVDAEF